MKYRTLTAIGLVVAVLTGLAARELAYAVFARGPLTDLLATALFLGGFVGGLLGFVGFFRMREGKPFLGRPF